MQEIGPKIKGKPSLPAKYQIVTSLRSAAYNSGNACKYKENKKALFATATYLPLNMKISKIELAVRRLPDNKPINFVLSTVLAIFYLLSDRIKVYNARKTRLYKNAYGPLPRVLVYIPTYNRVEYLLKRSIPSILSQTYGNIDILIVDDGSTDGTKDIISKTFGEKVRVVTNDRTKYRYPNNSLYHWFAGPVDAANLALSISEADWIARIDDDDEWEPDHIELALKHLLTTKAEFYSADYVTYNDQGEMQEILSIDPNNGIAGTQTWVYNGALKNIRYNMHCWRKGYNRVNDTDLQSRFYRAGLKIIHNPYVACRIRPRDDEQYIGSKAYIGSPQKYEEFYGG